MQSAIPHENGEVLLHRVLVSLADGGFPGTIRSLHIINSPRLTSSEMSLTFPCHCADERVQGNDFALSRVNSRSACLKPGSD